MTTVVERHTGNVQNAMFIYVLPQTKIVSFNITLKNDWTYTDIKLLYL